MKKEYKILLVIFILALIIRIVFLFSTPVKIWDETVYANLGHDLSNNFSDYSVENNGWSDFISSSEGSYGWPNMGFRAPLLPYILSSLYFKFNNYDKEYFQKVAQVNYPENYDFTRITEFKHFSDTKVDKPSVAIEYSCEFIPKKNERYYPIPNKGNIEKYKLYF